MHRKHNQYGERLEANENYSAAVINFIEIKTK